jgi:hypothetical protein
VGNVARMGENKYACMLLTIKPDGNVLFGIPLYIDERSILKSTFKGQ